MGYCRAINDQVKVLRRIPEKMDPALYYKTFRPYIRFFENVFYEVTEQRPVDDPIDHAPAMVRMNFRGETGAQSSIMPTLVAFMKIPHRPSMLTNHLADMRNYMPAEHRQLIEAVEAMPSIRELADTAVQCGARRDGGLPPFTTVGHKNTSIAGPTTRAAQAARHIWNGCSSSSKRPAHSRSFE